MRLLFSLILLFAGGSGFSQTMQKAWIRINQLGYKPASPKVAVWCSKDSASVTSFQLIDAETKKIVFSAKTSKAFGAYGPFRQTYRLNFSAFNKPGKFYLYAGGVQSPEFRINDTVYKGAADFCLRYMRQQRCGFNPFLRDSCHNRGCYSLYGSKAGLPDSSFVDISGGWHDASDYLQYATTSANATYHLMMAYRDFPQAFADEKQANGLDGKNGLADVLDEARWGLDWLLKMHPKENWMFNQVADDRDHISMRIPKLDSQYGRGYQRPAYFINGEPQQRGKFLNNTTGTSSTAAKLSSAFALGLMLFQSSDTAFARLLLPKVYSALEFAKRKLGVTQTVSVKSPYIYAEDNWKDDMELARAVIAQMEVWPGINRFTCGNQFDYILYQSELEPVTPWMKEDTAKHYQWYPFINIGHYELLRLYNISGDWAKKESSQNPGIIKSSAITSRALNMFGPEPNITPSTAVCPSSGAATTLRHLLPHSATGTRNSPATGNLKNWNKPTLTGSLAAIPGEPAWCTACRLGATHLSIRIQHSHTSTTTRSTAGW